MKKYDKLFGVLFAALALLMCGNLAASSDGTNGCTGGDDPDNPPTE